MKCTEIKPLFSSYLDGALTGGEMRAVVVHLGGCRICAAEFASLKHVQALVSSLQRPSAPPDIALRIRLAISKQHGMSWQRRIQGMLVRVENALNIVMIPATGGLVTTVLVFGLLIGFFAAPRSSAANDVPTLLYTPPKLVSAPFSDDVDVNASVVVEAQVDSEGRVVDYRILAGQENAQVRRELDRALLFTTFEPATAFGEPAPGQIVLSFANVNVKG